VFCEIIGQVELARSPDEIELALVDAMECIRLRRREVRGTEIALLLADTPSDRPLIQGV
jgi:hypothetical protein